MRDAEREIMKVQRLAENKAIDCVLVEQEYG
jgi:hypothetical protein